MDSHKSRIEVNDQGEFYIVLPEDLVAELELDEGDPVTIYDEDGSLSIVF